MPTRSTRGRSTRAVYNEFDKSLSYYPKGPVTEGNTSNDNARIVVAHANDIDGKPYRHELVCWMVDSNAEGVLPFTGTTGPAAGRFYVESSPEFLTGLLLNVASCARTDANGNVAIEVFDSNRTQVNVIALFADEGLLRDIKVDFAVSGSSGGTPPPTPTDPHMSDGPATGQGTTAPTVQELVKVAGPPQPQRSLHHRGRRPTRPRWRCAARSCTRASGPHGCA